MTSLSPLTLFQLVGLFLLCTGLYGVIARRSLIGMAISMELMVNGAGLSMVAAAQLTSADPVLGQLSLLFFLGLAAAETALLLAVIMLVFRRFKTSEADELDELKG